MKEIDVRLNMADVEVILRALGEVPAKLSLNPILKIQQQIKEQDTNHDSTESE